MIKEIKIQNYKSIHKLKLELGRVTVLIGENGSGKSNILEAIALASAAADDKLDNEFLASRGIRVTEPQLMRSAFEKDDSARDIKLSLLGQNCQEYSFVLHNEGRPYSQWINKEADQLIIHKFRDFVKAYNGNREELIEKISDDFFLKVSSENRLVK
ncbi:MAG: AAA family ATPase [Richelia sp. CSU_2_1]|nr:AAA family ATPase [Richelia sp. CSU_2_1]